MWAETCCELINKNICVTVTLHIYLQKNHKQVATLQGIQ
jgi:hypothetical protein